MFDVSGNKQAIFGNLNTNTFSVVVYACPCSHCVVDCILKYHYLGEYINFVDMICVHIWHHSVDIKVGMWQQFSS